MLAEDAADLSTLFRERGYLDPVPVLDREECARLLAVVLAETRGPLDWHKGWAASSPVYYRIATDERIVALVTKLLGPDVLLWGASLLTRPPGVAHPWHTDIESSDPRSETVAVWLALAETNAASSLKVVPYSHRFGRELQRVMQEHRATRETVTDDDVAAWARELDDRSGMVTAATADGQALVFDGRLWHGSQNLNESGTRQALLLQYTTPHVPVRIPNLEVLTWPFELFDEPKPGCLVVSGDATDEANRLVPGPVADGTPAIGPRACPIELPLARDREVGWKPHPLFAGATADVPAFGCHVSVLDSGRSPHAPHRHDEEEILIVLDGEAQIVTEDGRRRLPRGAFAYYPSEFAHTIENASDAPVTYLMFKWQTDRNASGPLLGNQVAAAEADAGGADALVATGIWDGPTKHLGHLHCHVTTLQPGAGYDPHADSYDVAIALLEGTVETLGERVSAPAAIFYPAGTLHGMRNPGEGRASYAVFELHRRARPSTGPR